MVEASRPPTDAYNTIDIRYKSYPSQSSMYTSPWQNTRHGGHSTGGYGPSVAHSSPTGGYGPSTSHSGTAGGYGPSAGHSVAIVGYGPSSGHSTGGYGSHYSSYRY